jgi:hemerythrin-like domain-containing protein
VEDIGSELVQAGHFQSGETRARFARLLNVLAVLYQEHIRLEEEEVLPLAARVLDPEDLHALGREMAERRKGEHAKDHNVP